MGALFYAMRRGFRGSAPREGGSGRRASGCSEGGDFPPHQLAMNGIAPPPTRVRGGGHECRFCLTAEARQCRMG
jgi:hypothetical protein